jgi:imidazolonepropionase-like amidohydrolase
MRLDIVNADVITGDGETVLEGASVIVEDGLIVDVPRHRYVPYNFYADRVIDARGGIVIPGIVNTHSHAVSFGPTLVWGWPQIPRERILGNLNRHLLEGTTTLLNLDGWVLPHENAATNKIHPINIRPATLHTPRNVIQAETESGSRIDERHRNFTAEEAVAAGALALGEVGSPATTFGTYEKIQRLGRVISPRAAQALDEAYMKGDEAAFADGMKLAGLDSRDDARRLVEETSIRAIAASDDAILETIEVAPRLGVPALCHTEPPSYDAVLQVARALGPQLLALHVNHHCSVEQALDVAKELKRHGSHVELLVGDSFGAGLIEPDPKPGLALLDAGLVDSICTDYSGGYHDPMLQYCREAMARGAATLPALVRLLTSSPASFIPGLAPNRGLVEEGRVADLTIVDRGDIANVRTVIIGGELVVDAGRIVH